MLPDWESPECANSFNQERIKTSWLCMWLRTVIAGIPTNCRTAWKRWLASLCLLHSPKRYDSNLQEFLRHWWSLFLVGQPALAVHPSWVGTQIGGEEGLETGGTGRRRHLESTRGRSPKKQYCNRQRTKGRCVSGVLGACWVCGVCVCVYEWMLFVCVCVCVCVRMCVGSKWIGPNESTCFYAHALEFPRLIEYTEVEGGLLCFYVARIVSYTALLILLFTQHCSYYFLHSIAHIVCYTAGSEGRHEGALWFDLRADARGYKWSLLKVQRLAHTEKRQTTEPRTNCFLRAS